MKVQNWRYQAKSPFHAQLLVKDCIMVSCSCSCCIIELPRERHLNQQLEHDLKAWTLPLCECQYPGCVGRKALITPPVSSYLRKEGGDGCWKYVGLSVLEALLFARMSIFTQKQRYCRDKLKCPICVSTWGCCKPSATTAAELCWDFTHSFHSCQALGISLLQEHLPHLSWHIKQVFY